LTGQARDVTIWFRGTHFRNKNPETDAPTRKVAALKTALAAGWPFAGLPGAQVPATEAVSGSRL